MHALCIWTWLGAAVYIRIVATESIILQRVRQDTLHMMLWNMAAPRRLSKVLPGMNVNERGCECKCDARRLITCNFPENKDEARPRYSIPGIAASWSPPKILSLVPTSALKQTVRGDFGSLSKLSTHQHLCPTSIFVLKHRAYGDIHRHFHDHKQIWRMRRSLWSRPRIMTMPHTSTVLLRLQSQQSQPSSPRRGGPFHLIFPC